MHEPLQSAAWMASQFDALRMEARTNRHVHVTCACMRTCMHSQPACAYSVSCYLLLLLTATNHLLLTTYYLLLPAYSVRMVTRAAEPVQT